MAVSCKREVAALSGGLESAPQDIAAGPDISRPRYDVSPEVFVGPSLEALQLALFDQLVAEPAKLKAGGIVAEAWPSNMAKRNIVVAGTVAVASLEAEIDRTANRHARKIRIDMPNGRHELRQNIERREGGRIAHQGQLNELPDRPAS